MRHGQVTERGVDTWRLLFAADAHSPGRRVFELPYGYVGQWFPEHGTLAVEGHPAGRGELARPEELPAAFARISEVVGATFGAELRGVARSDITAGYSFGREQEARAFFAGMAAVELPRCETTRRGSPVHSVWWTGAKGRKITARVYDKGLERGGEAFQLARLEDQRRYPSGARIPIDVLGEDTFCRDRFASRFDPVRKAVDGLKCASIPVIGQALADEVKYGYRDAREAERLAGSLILLAGGARDGYTRATYYRRRRELREAGFVAADEWMEPVEVDLGQVVDEVVSSW